MSRSTERTEIHDVACPLAAVDRRLEDVHRQWLRVTCRAIQYGFPDLFRFRPGKRPRLGIEVFRPVLGEGGGIMVIDPVVFVQPGPNLRPISSAPKTVERREATEFGKPQFFAESIP